MPSLLHRPSKADLMNDNTNGNVEKKADESKVNLPNGNAQPNKAKGSKNNLPKGTASATLAKQETSGEQKNMSNGGAANGLSASKEARNTPTRKAMQGFLQKTGANLKATGANLKVTGANLKASGAKLERRIPRRTKSKVVKPSSKRNSGVQVRTFDLDNKTLDRMTASPKERKATAGFLEKQRNRVTARKVSTTISMLSTPHQAEKDRRPLSANELEAMFLGAPYFNVVESKGRYRPHVTFQGGDARAWSKMPPDHAAFGHSSFASSTLYRKPSHESGPRPLLSRTKSNDTEAPQEGNEPRELPNMLSAHGLDPGAVGFEHFLQMPIADTIVMQQEKAVLDKRKQLKLDPEWLGLREINMEHMIHRLNELGEIHTGIKEEQWECPAPFSGGKVEEMGEELFEKLLSAELGTSAAGTGSVTLKTQIAALQRILNTTGLWHDFSLVEWRIRVGQLLWSSPESDIGQLEEDRPPGERDVLLLQITLAAELLIRLHALEALSSSFPPAVSQQDADALETQRTVKIQWDLVLAERFLENINIAPKVPSESEKKANRASFFSAITFFTAKETEDDFEESVQPILTPKNETEQLAGLVNFAESIGWPHASDVKIDLEAKLFKPSKDRRPVSTAASIYATPLSSPKFSNTPGTRTSFFGFSDKHGPGCSRTATTQSVQLSPARNIAGNIESFEVGGWLSRSWLSGLIMPGESAYHMLISALLENSPQAITSLGSDANLYGGFVYEGRSYWSTTCAVGRVLAASAGVKECMGWISVPETQLGEDRWVEVAVKEISLPVAKPQIKTGDRIAQDSAPLHKHSVSPIQAGDFVRPTDGPPVMGNEIKCDGLSFNSSMSSSNSETTITADAMASSTACLTFSSPINSRLDKMAIPITYDVQFVSSYPCHPRTTKPRSGSRPMTPSLPSALQNRDSSQATPKSNSNTPKTKTPTDSKHPSKAGSTSTLNFSVFEKELPTTPAHPLHIDYSYEIIPVANLMSTPPESRPRALSSPKERKMSTATITSNNEDVVVLDCRGTEDLELFARAWCCKVGENALIGKSGRTCLACCVREARALGLCVVIRT